MAFRRNTEDVESVTAGIPTEDAVAKLTEWDPLVSGGANFRTHKLKKVGFHSYISAPTVGYHLFYMLFVLSGIGCMVGGYFQIGESWFEVFILFMVGSIFTALGGFIGIKSQQPFTIDLDLGTFYKGRSYDPYDDHADGKSGSVRDIYALQIISERIKGNKSSYTSYEMNLVLKDGRRVNVMDHGSRKKIYEDAELLREALDVPVWDTAK